MYQILIHLEKKGKMKKKKNYKKKYDYIKPSHHRSKSGRDAIEVLDDFEVTCPLVWNACKYLLRLGKKPNEPILHEAKKAKEYLERKIEFLEKEAKKKKKMEKRKAKGLDYPTSKKQMKRVFSVWMDLAYGDED